MTDFFEVEDKIKAFSESMCISISDARSAVTRLMRPSVRRDYLAWQRGLCRVCGHGHHRGTITMRLNGPNTCTGCDTCGEPKTNYSFGRVIDEIVNGSLLDRVLYGDGPKEPQGILNTSPLASFALPSIPDMLRDARERPLFPSIPMAIHPDDHAQFFVKNRLFDEFSVRYDPDVPKGSAYLMNGSAVEYDTVSSMLVKVGPGHINLNPFPKITPDDICNAFGVPASIITHQHQPQTERKNMTNIRAILQHQMDSAAERLANLDRFPKDDNYPLGTLIGFDRKFDTGETVYHYAGVKTEKGWFITGREAHRAFTWDGLMLWLAEDGGECTALVVCAEVTELIEPTEEGEAYATDGEES